MQKNELNRWIKPTAFILFMTAYVFYVVGLFMRIPINSDFSNLVLEANDILSGNIFLSGWNLTGITFVSTDLLFFIAGAIVAGTSIKAYIIAVSLMFLALFLSGMTLLSTKNKKISYMDFIIYFSVAGIPSAMTCNLLRAHTAVAAYLCIALFCLKKLYEVDEKERIKKRYLFLLTFVLSLGVMGDPIMLLIGILPIILVCIYNLIANKVTYIKLNFTLIGISVLSFILGTRLDALYISIGNVNKNEFLSDRLFVEFSELGDKFRLYFDTAFDIFNGYFFGKEITKAASIFGLMFSVVFIFGLIIVVKNIVDFLRRKRTDIVSVILSVGIAAISFAFIFTDISVDKSSGRYLAYFPVAFAVIFIRHFKEKGWYEKKIISDKVPLIVAAFVVSLFLIVVSFTPISLTRPVTREDGLGAFLQEKSLENGYAQFWNASNVTVSTKENVKVRAIIHDTINDKISKFNWFCKDDWYEPDYSNFVVIDTTDETPYGITESIIKKTIGKPNKILEYDVYKIYVYDYDIKNKIIK